MPNLQTVKRQLQKLKQVHAFVAPFVVIPIILTLITGSLYQAFALLGRAGDAGWLLSIHKGNFGPLHLDVIYPFLNALGLLFMAITGGKMWLDLRRIRSRSRAS
ncbi:PepSY domain-containing protein [Romeria aff. gracilis LEGE 07310]|uniref:PepSY domain-containing protein n=1 Tax=Vasconcelosia minhoensis LEGE 07310 TaxID=915328 RepID=A0A8J7DK61_9CYAN|nr:PepSY domain-containing protein [Romeria gracilis]MBE9075996.1 PepSY domain-containing protein [Romeria aff. gracilis LEGE 07310]